MSALKQALFDQYGGFADKRYKKLSSSDVFAIDGRSPADLAADGKFYGWFCLMFADTSDEPVIRVRLLKNVPDSPEVQTWIARHQAIYTYSPQEILDFKVAPNEQYKLLELAAAFEAIVKPGRRYSTPAYKYVCPRLGQSLRLLEQVLSSQWDSVDRRRVARD